jgi:hypothetical protein
VGMIGNMLRNTPFYDWLRPLAVRLAQPGAVRTWERQGRPVPPPHSVKQQVLREFSDRYGLRILVETGTYYGDMVAAMMPQFDAIYSIELSAELHQKARRRFRRSGKTTLINGDSAVALAAIVRELDQPTLFWLDGHYSGGETARGASDTPVVAELKQILSCGTGNVIIIDDARLFGTNPGYPTLEEVNSLVKGWHPDLDVEVELDSIRVTPRRS